VTAFDDVYDKLLKPMHSGDAMQPAESWQAARTAVYIMSNFEEHVCCLTGDTMMDTMAAGGLVGSCGKSYQFVEEENQVWRKSPPLWNGLPKSEGSATGDYRVSVAYPGPEKVGLLDQYENVFDPIDEYITNDRSTADLSWQEVHDLLMSWKPESLHDYADSAANISSAMDVAAQQIKMHAADIRDAPWTGSAADNAQNALKKIYDNVIGLSDVHAKVTARANECARLIGDYQYRFKGQDWGFSDLWSDIRDKKDPKAVAFLADFDSHLAEIIKALPPNATSALPGLIPEKERSYYEFVW
jgi:hypothetical protein